MDEESLPSDEDRGSASDDESRSGSDPGSSEASNVEDEELSGGGPGLAPYSFEPSNSDSTSAVPDDEDDDDARDERLSDMAWQVLSVLY